MTQRPRFVVGNEAGDATIVIPRRALQHAAEMASPVTAVHDDRTIVRLPATAVKLLRPPMLPVVGPAYGESHSTDIDRRAPVTPAPSPRTPWAARVSTQVITITAGGALLVAVSMGLWHMHSVRVTAVAHATTLVNWLAAIADNPDSQTGVMTTADAVAREPGVITALVLRTDGRVLFPASRNNEVLDLIPGLNVPVSDLFQLRTGTSNGVLYIARPVVGARGSPAAVALITLQLSASQDLANIFFLLGPLFIVVVAAALMVAASIRQSILVRLAVLNEDVELAIGGQLDSVEDPVGVPPLKALTNTINYLVARLRYEGRRRKTLPDVVGASSSSNGRVRTQDLSCQLIQSPARIVADSKFRITVANQECFQVLGLHPHKMIGRHIVDAFQPKALLVEAVLGCLASLPATGESHVSVADEGSVVPLQIVLARTKDHSLTITFSRSGLEHARGAPDDARQ